MYCLDCDTTFDSIRSKLSDLEEASRLYETTKMYIKTGNIKEALENAKKCLEIRKCILYEHHEAVALAYDMIGQILAIMGKISVKIFII